MNAIILAGGKGTRLRPLTCNIPKPMVKLFDRPVMEHIIRLLVKNGFNNICATLQYLPHIISGHFGNGKDFGCHISYTIEDTPLGTAGSVKKCTGFIENNDFLVISGDAVCDFDLQKCIEFHNQKNAAVTIVTYRHPTPLEYGLIVSDSDGKIETFIEKPSWNQVFINTVNTGIYIISPEVMTLVPENTAFDFARDLFPLLLKENKPMYAFEAEGYWCDIGSCESYMECMQDILKGKTCIDIGAPVLSPGIRSLSEIPKGVSLIAPCFIGKNVTLSQGCIVGPDTVICSDSVLERGSAVHQCVVDGGYVGTSASARGSIICRGAFIGSEAYLAEGSVIGENTVIGSNVRVSENSKIWPNKEIEAGSVISGNFVSGHLRHRITWQENSVITGSAETTLNPRTCFSLGAACSCKTAGLSHCGSSYAELAANAFACGIRSAGGNVIITDALFENQCAFAASLYGFEISVFIDEKDGVLNFSFFDSCGNPLSSAKQRAIESSLNRGEVETFISPGKLSRITGISEAYHTFIIKNVPPLKNKFILAVSGISHASKALCEVLKDLGAQLWSDQVSGIPHLSITSSGSIAAVSDETGSVKGHEQIIALMSDIAFRSGIRTLACTHNAPLVLDQIAEKYRASLLRVNSDNGAEELLESQRFMSDGIFALAKICSYLSEHSLSFADALANLPSFSAMTREIPLLHERGHVITAANTKLKSDKQNFNGVRLYHPKGSVTVFPSSARESLHLYCEAASAEYAEELCQHYEKLIQRIDSNL